MFSKKQVIRRLRNFILELTTNYDQIGDQRVRVLFDAGEFPENHLIKCDHLFIYISLKWINEH